MNGCFSDQDTFGARWLQRALLAVSVVVWAVCSAPSGEAQADTASEPISVVCLHTEFFPLEDDERLVQRRLVRELVRQAILIAARDELGLATRDETLQEPFPEETVAGQKAVRVRVRHHDDGTCEIKLWRHDRWAPEKTWTTTVEFENSPGAIYSSLARELEPLTRGGLVEALSGLGAGRGPAATRAEGEQPESPEELLRRIDFVSQYAAVRQAHWAIAEHGPSQAWLGVLVRGYAHLALLTQHHWTSSPEVFAARSMLYAERMVASVPKDASAHCHRAYAWAVVGMHNAALDEMETVSALQKKAAAAELPAWAAVIGPYCRFERETLLKLGEADKELRPLVAVLSFEQHKQYEDDRWLYNSARRAIERSPESYVIYAGLATETTALGPSRMGASAGPTTLGESLPRTLARLEDLPENVRTKPEPELKEALKKYIDPDPDDPFSVMPGYIAADLSTATREGKDAGEPSWAVLGQLILEERFAQIASYLKVAQNATESSQTEEAAGIAPLVKSHRYGRHVESYSVNYLVELKRYYEILGDMQWVDPRGNMWDMLHRAWNAYDRQGKTRRGKAGAQYAFKSHDTVLPSMIEAYDRVSYSCWDDMKKKAREDFAREFEEVSRYSPYKLRLEQATTPYPSLAKLAEWEAQGSDQPALCYSLGDSYYDLGQYEDAARCFKRATELSPSPGSFISLANSYRKAGKEELWLPTLKRYLEVDDLGLGHARIHTTIAEDFIEKGKWEEAEPHAWHAAQTYSAWGMELASIVYEGLGRWYESEHWARDATTSYRSSFGYYWYFWCLRTGRGKLEEAHKLADDYVKLEGLKTKNQGRGQLFLASWCDGKPHEALEHLKALAEMCRRPPSGWIDRSYAQTQLALVAREVGDHETEQAAVAELRRIIGDEIQPENRDFAAINLAVWRALSGKLPNEKSRADFDKLLETQDRARRCDYEYFLGRVFELAGDTDAADGYYRRAVTRGPYGRHNATLAGYYLSKRHGTSRPDSLQGAKPQATDKP